MPQLSGAGGRGGGGGGGGDPELCATDEMIPFKDEGDPQKEKIFAEISHPEEEGDLADIKSSLVNESETIPNGHDGHEVGGRGRRERAGPVVFTLAGEWRRRSGANPLEGWTEAIKVTRSERAAPISLFGPWASPEKREEEKQNLFLVVS